MIKIENKEKIDGIIAKGERIMKELIVVVQKNELKKKINNELDLTIDNFMELLKELKETKRPLTKERRDYFLKKLDNRHLALSSINEQKDEILNKKNCEGLDGKSVRFPFRCTQCNYGMSLTSGVPVQCPVCKGYMCFVRITMEEYKQLEDTDGFDE